MDCRSVAFELLHLLYMAWVIPFNLIVREWLVIWRFIITLNLRTLFIIAPFSAVILIIYVIFRWDWGRRRSARGRKHLSLNPLHWLFAACILEDSILLRFLTQVCQSDLSIKLKFLRVIVGGTDTPFHKVLLHCLSVRHCSLTSPLLSLFLTAFTFLSHSRPFIASRVFLRLILYLARWSCQCRILSDILTLF